MHGAGLVSVAAVNGPDSLTLAGPRRLVELVASAALSPSTGSSSSSGVAKASGDGSLESLEEGGRGNIGEGPTSAGDGIAPAAGTTSDSLGSKAIDLPPDRFRILQGVSRAFHSPAMTLAAIGTQQAARKVSLRDPAIPLASNVTGRLAKAGELTDPAYWSKVRHGVPQATTEFNICCWWGNIEELFRGDWWDHAATCNFVSHEFTPAL